VRLLAAVPIKALDEAKSRLQEEDVDRGRLTLAMLDRVLDAIHASRAVNGIVVVSPDPDVLRHVESRATPVLQRTSGLNEAAEEAAMWAVCDGADALLIVHGDLPWLTPEDVSAMRSLADEGTVVLAPDRAEKGTNMLLASPPAAIHYKFGPDSFARHQSEARAEGLHVRMYRSESAARDVDTAEDLAACMPLLATCR